MRGGPEIAPRHAARHKPRRGLRAPARHGGLNRAPAASVAADLPEKFAVSAGVARVPRRGARAHEGPRGRALLRVPPAGSPELPGPERAQVDDAAALARVVAGPGL